MSNQVDRPPQTTTEVSTPRTSQTLPDEAENKKTIFGRIIKKIGSFLKQIKNKITFKTDTDILARKIDTKYAESTQETKLTSLEYLNLATKGDFSNNTLYIITDDVNIENINNLPMHVKFLQDVTITNSPKLKHLPPNFTCLGNVTIQKCANFNMKYNSKSILNIHGTLTISNCNSFSYLPPKINSDVHISNCTKFKQLLAGNYKNITIEECNNFQHINSYTVTENLLLIKNNNFRFFPDNLTVKDLSVINCPIKYFNSKITILGNLLLKSCSALRKAESPNVKLMGNITIDDCYDFVKSMKPFWSEWICSPKDDDSLREMKIYMKSSNGFFNMHVPYIVNLVHPSLEDIAKGNFVFDMLSVITFFMKYAEAPDKLVVSYLYQLLKLSNRDAENLDIFLEKVMKTNDYKFGNRKLLAQQVV